MDLLLMLLHLHLQTNGIGEITLSVSHVSRLLFAAHVSTTDNNRSSWHCDVWCRFLVPSKIHLERTTVCPTKITVQKYLLPNLRPPAASAYEEDRDALTAQFDAAETLLKEIQTETAAVRTAVEEQKERVDKTTEEVESMVKEMREGELKTRDEMREIREEVNNVREMLPKVRFRRFLTVHQAHHSIQMIEKNKDSQTQSLAELQQELKSLKALLLSRGSTMSPAPASPLPSFTGRPSIPAWQLAGTGQTNGVSTPTSTSISSPVSTIPPPVVNGKGKEPEVVPAEAASSS